MTAKQQALKDIRESLREEGKSFLMYRRELNKPIMALVREHIKEQKKYENSH